MKDYAHGGKQRAMTLLGTEFLRRFFLHVLPKGFVRIRYFGFLANRFRARCLALPATTGERSPAALYFLGDDLQLALPQLRCRDACHSQTHRCGTLAVLLLRYLLMLRTTADHRRAPSAPADLCACPSPHRLPGVLSALASSYFPAIAKALCDLFAYVGSLTSACGSSKAAFISHSQRPPQTPAPSF